MVRSAKREAAEGGITIHAEMADDLTWSCSVQGPDDLDPAIADELAGLYAEMLTGDTLFLREQGAGPAAGNPRDYYFSETAQANGFEIVEQPEPTPADPQARQEF